MAVAEQRSCWQCRLFDKKAALWLPSESPHSPPCSAADFLEDGKLLSCDRFPTFEIGFLALPYLTGVL